MQYISCQQPVGLTAKALGTAWNKSETKICRTVNVMITSPSASQKPGHVYIIIP